MNDTTIAPATVIAVLLADGWHRVLPGSFSVGALSFGAEAGPGTPGFRFEQAETGSPYRPATLAGPLDSIIASTRISSAAISSSTHRPAAAPITCSQLSTTSNTCCWASTRETMHAARHGTRRRLTHSDHDIRGPTRAYSG